MKNLKLVAFLSLLTPLLVGCEQKPEQKPEQELDPNLKKIICTQKWELESEGETLIDTAVITFVVDKTQFRLKNPVGLAQVESFESNYPTEGKDPKKWRSLDMWQYQTYKVTPSHIHFNYEITPLEATFAIKVDRTDLTFEGGTCSAEDVYLPKKKI